MLLILLVISRELRFCVLVEWLNSMSWWMLGGSVSMVGLCMLLIMVCSDRLYILMLWVMLCCRISDRLLVVLCVWVSVFVCIFQSESVVNVVSISDSIDVLMISREGCCRNVLVVCFKGMCRIVKILKMIVLIVYWILFFYVILFKMFFGKKMFVNVDLVCLCNVFVGVGVWFVEYCLSVVFVVLGMLFV